MGQKIGRLPDTWSELMEEKNRVLHWSSEVLARVDKNIRTEDTFLRDYDNATIDGKVNRWIENHRPKWEYAFSRLPQERSRNLLKAEVAKIAEDLEQKMRKDYQEAYSRMKKFTKRVDALGIDERKLHAQMHSLEGECENDPKIFIAKFRPLRKRILENVRKGEKMELEEKKLKVAFTRKVYEIDRKYIEECARRIDHLVKDCETSTKNS